jgi:PAS domain S-box-containing protein
MPRPGLQARFLARVRSDSQFHRLFDHLPEVYFFAKDAEGRVVAANPPLYRRFGFSTEEEILGKTDFDFLPRSLAEKYREDDRAVLASGRPSLRLVELWVNRQGVTEWFLTDKLPVFGKSGRPIGVMGIIRDYDTARPLLPESDRLLSALNSIRSRLPGRVPLRALARESGLSIRQFERAFKERFGMSAMQYVMKLRVHLACEKLRADGASIVDAALASGFYDQSSFTRHFRRHMGMTPGRYRRWR